MKKMLFMLILICFICILFGLVSVNNIIEDAKEEAIQLENIDLDVAMVADGMYKGHSEIGPVIVEVEVTIKDGVIRNIEIIQHQNGLGEAANSIIEDMLKNNTYSVDAVSGATISSKVIINAVNDALQKGLLE